MAEVHTEAMPCPKTCSTAVSQPSSTCVTAVCTVCTGMYGYVRGRVCTGPGMYGPGTSVLGLLSSDSCTQTSVSCTQTQSISTQTQSIRRVSQSDESVRRVRWTSLDGRVWLTSLADESIRRVSQTSHTGTRQAIPAPVNQCQTGIVNRSCMPSECH